MSLLSEPIFDKKKKKIKTHTQVSQSFDSPTPEKYYFLLTSSQDFSTATALSRWLSEESL